MMHLGSIIATLAIAQAPAQVPQGWVEVASKDGKYRFAMPAKPEEIVGVQRTPTGQKPTYSYTAQAKLCRYFWYEVPAPGPLAEDEKRPYLKHWVETNISKDKLISHREVDLDGFPGQEFTQKAKVGLFGGEGKMVSRIYLIGDDMITIRVIPNMGGIDPPDVDAFFGTFRLATPKKADRPQPKP